VEQRFRETQARLLLPSLGTPWRVCLGNFKMRENAVYRYLGRLGQAVFESETHQMDSIAHGKPITRIVIVKLGNIHLHDCGWNCAPSRGKQKQGNNK
jgi:hypothetical protein